MKTKDKELMNTQIEKHGQQLNDLFNTGLDNVTLCKRLHSLEYLTTYWSTEYCNTGKDSDYLKALKKFELAKKLLFKDGFQFFKPELYKAVILNLDPRGYALKISDKYMRENNINLYKDWGGYGILAPDFTPNN